MRKLHIIVQTVLFICACAIFACAFKAVYNSGIEEGKTQFIRQLEGVK